MPGGPWFGRRGQVVLLAALLIAWGLVLFVTRSGGAVSAGPEARAASPGTRAPASSAASAPAGRAASASNEGGGSVR